MRGLTSMRIVRGIVSPLHTHFTCRHQPTPHVATRVRDPFFRCVGFYLWVFFGTASIGIRHSESRHGSRCGVNAYNSLYHRRTERWGVGHGCVASALSALAQSILHCSSRPGALNLSSFSTSTFRELEKLRSRQRADSGGGSGGGGWGVGEGTVCMTRLKWPPLFTPGQRSWLITWKRCGVQG